MFLLQMEHRRLHLNACPPHKQAEALWDVTHRQKYKEASHNRCAPCKKSTNFLDRGSGAPIIVSCTLKEMVKTRLIDDGKRGGQNQWAALNESIYTIGVDLISAIADRLICKTSQSGSSKTLRGWMDVLLCTGDLPDAFRGCTVHAGDQRAAVVAVSVNRYPTLVTAVLRRTLGLLAVAYFDYNVLVEIAAPLREEKAVFIIP